MPVYRLTKANGRKFTDDEISAIENRLPQIPDLNATCTGVDQNKKSLELTLSFPRLTWNRIQARITAYLGKQYRFQRRWQKEREIKV